MSGSGNDGRALQRLLVGLKAQYKRLPGALRAMEEAIPHAVFELHVKKPPHCEGQQQN